MLNLVEIESQVFAVALETSESKETNLEKPARQSRSRCGNRKAYSEDSGIILQSIGVSEVVVRVTDKKRTWPRIGQVRSRPTVISPGQVGCDNSEARELRTLWERLVLMNRYKFSVAIGSFSVRKVLGHFSA